MLSLEATNENKDARALASDNKLTRRDITLPDDRSSGSRPAIVHVAAESHRPNTRLEHHHRITRSGPRKPHRESEVRNSPLQASDPPSTEAEKIGDSAPR